MSHINYPLAEDFAPNKYDQEVDIFVGKSGSEFNADAKIERLRFALKGKLGGQIKFILGFIYFFSLLYFTVKLLT
jgi:hypothetical protein